MDSRIQEVLRLLDGSWRAPLRVIELADRVGLGPSRLEHLFRSEVNESIRAYVNRQRLLAAARMLTASNERVSSIAFEVGFNDVSNFNHAFKKHFGKSPQEYRRAIFP